MLFFLHLRHSPSPNVPPLPRAQDVHLAQPDPTAAEDGAQLDVGRHDVPQQAGSSIHSRQFFPKFGNLTILFYKARLL